MYMDTSLDDRVTALNANVGENLSELERLELHCYVEAIMNIESEGMEYMFCHTKEDFDRARKANACPIRVDEQNRLVSLKGLTGYISKESMVAYNRAHKKVFD